VLDVDLLIIGSGPAGLSTALHLLQQDVSWAERMILLEKAAHPRPKLCGGGVTRIGLEALLGLGVQLPLPIPSVEIEEARFIYQDNRVSFRGQPEFVVYNRIEFDAFLYQHARQQGVVIHENEPVQSITFNPQGVEVITSKAKYKAKVVVGADGSKGVTRRLVNRKETKGRVARVIETVDPAQDNLALLAEGYAVFDLTKCEQDLQGYYWEFPSIVDDMPSVNRGVYDSRIAPKREIAGLPAILEAQTNEASDRDSEVSFQGHPIHWFHPRNRVAIPRMLLVGDAAGVDPLFGEGIGPALAYGKLAAEEVVKSFGNDDFSFRGYKPRLLISSVGRYLIFRWLLAWISYHLSWSQTFMHALWSLGKVVAAILPKPRPLYNSHLQLKKGSARRS
jgi:flavin-dependent dehydrogenase